MSFWLVVLELQVHDWGGNDIAFRPLFGLLGGDGERVVEGVNTML